MSIRRKFPKAAIFLIWLLVQAAMACSVPFLTEAATSTPDRNLMATNVAQTVQAVLPTRTATLAVPPTSAAPLPTQSPPALPGTSVPATLPASFPMIRSSADTNCREGPNKIYPRVGYLLVGQQSLVHGRNEDNSWWYIENPAKPGEFCWVWAQTTQVDGDVSGLPVIPAPPIPTPAPGSGMGVSFANMHNCGGKPTLMFQVMNSATDRIRSASLYVYDVTSDEILYELDILNSPFMVSPADCPPGSENLNVGEMGYLGAHIDGPAPSGDSAQAEISLCAEKDLFGDCVDVTVQFVIP